MEEMRASDLYRDVDWDYLVGMPEIQVFPDRELAASSGVSMEDLAETVRTLVGGVRVGTYEDRGRRYDVRVRLLSQQRTGALDLGRLKVRADNGELVPLKALVRQEPTRSMLQITRKGRERSITLFANVGPEGSQAEAVQRLQERAQAILPPGYHAVLSGSAQALTESFQELKFAILFGIAIAYMILASQFNSLTHPLTVLIALPFSLSGALAALYLFDQTLNVYSFIGIVLLMGIVKKNSILLVDFTNQRRLLGDSRDAALLHACPLRLRPILMTSICTVAGALPAAVAAGPGAEVRQPMALAVVGGVVVSTAMTLLVVPALYSLLDGLSSRFSRAGKIEREATAVLADLQVEEAEAFRHGAPRAPEPVVAGETAPRA
jgi:HAE1 family hydrophobic/amphiphilic exporter-1